MNINRHWKKFVACSCPHGSLQDAAAVEAYLGFIDKFNPEARICLGDWNDFAAFRGGAAGTRDEAESLTNDLNAGIEFVELMRATHLLNGNHDIRVYKFARHQNAIFARCALSIINEMNATAARLQCHYVQDYDIRKSWIQLGDTKFLHGFFYNENAIRDHAEAFGKCVIGHLHRVGEEPGRRIDRPVGYCVGSLANEDRLEYGLTRRATLKHSNGFAYGEYCDDETKVFLARIENGVCITPL